MSDRLSRKHGVAWGGSGDLERMKKFKTDVENKTEKDA